METLNELIREVKDGLVRAPVDTVLHDQGRATAYMHLLNLIERPSPVPGLMKEPTNV